jgi:hypothetical protein
MLVEGPRRRKDAVLCERVRGPAHVGISGKAQERGTCPSRELGCACHVPFRTGFPLLLLREETSVHHSRHVRLLAKPIDW